MLAISAGVGALAVSFSSTPSSNTFRDLLQVDIALLIAYAVAIAGIAVGLRSIWDHLELLGLTSGIAACGAVAVALCVGLAAHLDAGGSGEIVWLGLCWIVAASFLLGALVVAVPYLTFVRSRS